MGAHVPLLAAGAANTVCHRTGNGRFQPIRVNGAAVAAHMAHGDARPGESVPGQPDKQFDDACNLRDVAPPLPTNHHFTGTIGGGPGGGGMCVGSGGGASFSNFGACEFVFVAGSDGTVSAALSWTPDLSPLVRLQMAVLVNGLFVAEAPWTSPQTSASAAVQQGDEVKVFFFYTWHWDAVETPPFSFSIAIEVPPGTTRTRP